MLPSAFFHLKSKS